ncbi:hypothetical protein F5884DRAFT_278330 [Xylogone sp. PMI_703]|nr:hypothetical protein F5884DRAFT_278330 [Xylogone sp. PMI_703]
MKWAPWPCTALLWSSSGPISSMYGMGPKSLVLEITQFSSKVTNPEISHQLYFYPYYIVKGVWVNKKMGVGEISSICYGTELQ